MSNIKLNIHPDPNNERSQYVRLYLEEFLVKNGVSSEKIIWRTPYILSFTPGTKVDIPVDQWIELINKKFSMNLCSLYQLKSEPV